MEEKVDEVNARKVKRIQTKKKISKQKNILILAIIIMLVVGLFIFKNQKSRRFYTSKEVVQTLVGKWTSDGNTIYEFNDNGSGTLIVPVLTVPFSYRIDDNIIYVDFENESSEDTDYEYLLEDNKLVLKNINGTFEFIRMEEQ